MRGLRDPGHTRVRTMLVVAFLVITMASCTGSPTPEPEIAATVVADELVGVESSSDPSTEPGAPEPAIAGSYAGTATLQEYSNWHEEAADGDPTVGDLLDVTVTMLPGCDTDACTFEYRGLDPQDAESVAVDSAQVSRGLEGTVVSASMEWDYECIGDAGEVVDEAVGRLDYAFSFFDPVDGAFTRMDVHYEVTSIAGDCDGHTISNGTLTR
ncbi:hypothetical protein [Occultella kanbiaonis]|uniref:hypothetical protein n=1 Tax=Occultella kanbiaonis TaxID=2675754 RepID=UPI0013D7FC4F|nr:hypothetical protein [Occultella kanbiaonis]